MTYEYLRHYLLRFIPAFCLCVWLAFGSSSGLAVPSVSAEEVDVPDSTIVQETEALDSDTPAPDDGDAPVSAVAETEYEYSNLAFYDVTCSLGSIRLYLPYGYESASIQLINGQLINTNASTVNLYCPEYPAYSFSASRFAPVQYRSTGQQSIVLDNVELTDSSFSFGESTPYVIVFCFIFIVLLGLGGSKSW